MQLSIVKFEVLDLALKKSSNDDLTTQIRTFEFSFSIQYDDANDQIFFVIFDINLTHPNEFVLNLKYNVVFKTTDPITDDFKNSPFTTVNAPAIAFPFVRSFISTVTLNSGYAPALLPSINFENLKKSDTN